MSNVKIWNKMYIPALSTGSTIYYKFHNNKLYILTGEFIRVFNTSNFNSGVSINSKTFIDDCIFNPEKIGYCKDIEVLPEIYDLWQDKILDEIMEIYQKN